MEQALRHLRNMVAHPDSYGLGSPVDSARFIRDVGEILNRLWGVSTAGGRLYPKPLQREIMAIGWDTAGKSATFLSLEQLAGPSVEGDYTYILIRAAREEEHWSWYDSLFETTGLPTDLLWGPGTRDNALAWADHERPEPDSVEHLDRLFLLQAENGEVGLPRHPDVAAGLAERDANGTWHAVRADYPGDAQAHVRGALEGKAACAAEGPCRTCAAETVARGARTEVIEKLSATGMTVTPVAPPDVRVPLHPLR